MSTIPAARSTEEWEAAVGAQVRDLRQRAELRQWDLAHLANISVSALQRLEAGQGSSLSTLIAVLRALDREAWLHELAPPAPVSPMAALRERRRAEERTRRRVSARRPAEA